MSTVKNLKVHKNYPCRVCARKQGKWDITATKIFTENNENITLPAMTNYDGLSATQLVFSGVADNIDFSNTVLPWKFQYNSVLDTTRYTLMPVGTIYQNANPIKYQYNGTVVGSPSFDNSTGIMSGFSGSNYLRLESYPQNFSSYEMVFKFKTPSSYANHYMTIIGQSGANYKTPQIDIETYGKVWCAATTSGSSPWKSIESSVLSTNTWYFVKFTWDGSNIEGFLSTDGTSWTSFGAAACSSVYWGDKALIGTEGDDSSFFTGLIDLSQSYIKVNGEYFWKGATEFPIDLLGCTYNFTDTGAATTLNCFAMNGDDRVILTPDNAVNGGWFLGTVSIAAHTVYTYNNGVWTPVS